MYNSIATIKIVDANLRLNQDVTHQFSLISLGSYSFEFPEIWVATSSCMDHYLLVSHGCIVTRAE